MSEPDLIWMSALIFTPSIVALVLMLLPRDTPDEALRWCSLIGTAATMGISLGVFIGFKSNVIDFNRANPDNGSLTNRHEKELDRSDPNNHEPRPAYDWIARYDWITRFHIEYFIGIDGISMALVLLTTVISFLSMIASWNITKHVRAYCILFLLLETGMIGTFLALDFFLFYIFWELMLLPMYFLIGVWGGPRREYAAIKFFLYTLLGSVFILIALIAFYFTNIQDVTHSPRAKNTFDILLLQKAGKEASHVLSERGDNGLIRAEERLNKVVTAEKPDDAKIETAKNEVSRWKQPFFSSPAFQITMFLLLFVGFAIKVPVFPFHTWLPDAHVEAPTPISMILAGVLLKMGGYGLIRIAYPICPWAAETLGYYIAIFGIINIVYGAFAAMAQTDFKKLVAYSSVSHMGYVILGIAVWSNGDQGSRFWECGLNGAMFQMLAHGITSAGMFFCVGVIYDRAHHRNLDNFRGLYEPMPLYGSISAILFFAAMGLPGMCGFFGELLVVLATWNYSPVLSILAAATVVITAAYILWTIQRVYMGQNSAYKDFPDITARELACAVPLVILAVALGVFPDFFVMSWMGPSVSELIKSLAH